MIIRDLSLGKMFWELACQRRRLPGEVSFWSFLFTQLPLYVPIQSMQRRLRVEQGARNWAGYTETRQQAETWLMERLTERAGRVEFPLTASSFLRFADDAQREGGRFRPALSFNSMYPDLVGDVSHYQTCLDSGVTMIRELSWRLPAGEKEAWVNFRRGYEERLLNMFGGNQVWRDTPNSELMYQWTDQAGPLPTEWVMTILFNLHKAFSLAMMSLFGAGLFHLGVHYRNEFAEGAAMLMARLNATSIRVERENIDPTHPEYGSWFQKYRKTYEEPIWLASTQVAVPWWLGRMDFEYEWTKLRTSDVAGLAKAIFEGQAIERLGILADAFMDAGCSGIDDEDWRQPSFICRQPLGTPTMPYHWLAHLFAEPYTLPGASLQSKSGRAYIESRERVLPEVWNHEDREEEPDPEETVQIPDASYEFVV